MKLNRVLLSLIGTGLLLSLHANALPVGDMDLKQADPKVQTLLKKSNLEVVDTKYVEEKIGKGLRVSAKALLVDARPSKKFMVGHVPSAINISEGSFKVDLEQLKDVDKTAEIITYCGGWKCVLAPKVAALLKAEGFTNVKVYQAGYPAWKKTGHYVDVSTLLVKSAVKKGDRFIIDARPEKVYTATRIKGAVNIPDTKFDTMKDKLPADKAAKIIVYCGGFKCAKSHNVARELVKLGYKSVSVYAAGLPAWEKDGLAVEGKRVDKANAPKEAKADTKEYIEAHGVQLVADQEENLGMVYGPWYKEMIKNVPENIVLVDVRSADSFAAGHIKGAISAPFDSKKSKDFVAELSTHNKIVIMNCAAGAMSTEAMMAVEKHGGDLTKVFYVDANIDCNAKHECTIKVNEPI
ncbi:SULFUR TRANSFERASE PRECURSOR [hydrothermal vent metagenome]|uniref:SULFUR TRANSFERASE n=1 Tax=hydrothermal vent metagenome TaxID=652676 RepID=A0A1W1EF22_9ZZZZ